MDDTTRDTPDDTPGAPDPTTDTLGSVLPVDLRDYVEPERGRATCRRVFATDQLALDVWCVEPRQATDPLHLPDRDVHYTIISGRSWFVTDAGEVGLDPLGAILVPADVVHGFENRGPDPLIVLASSAPPGQAPAEPPVERTDGAVTHKRESKVRDVVAKLLGTRPGTASGPRTG